jgi:hypothetical protein
MSVGFSHLNDAELETLHKSLHTDVANPAVLEAHHSVTTEILARGLEHGHEDDEWNRAVVELEIEDQIPVSKAIAEMPTDIAEQVIESLGNPEFVKKTTLLTVDGYTLKFDAFEKSEEVEMRLNETQKMLYETLEAVVERVGAFDQGAGANGAHYMEKNPFVKEGMICANCVFYEGGQGCEIVTGLIDPMALCKFWIIPEDLLDSSVSKHRAGQHDQKSHGSWAGNKIPNLAPNKIDESNQYGDEANSLARELRERMILAEPQLTADMVEIADANFGTMQGLENRVKSEESLARKIKNDSLEYGGDMRQATQKVSDGLRYSVTFDEENYAESVVSTIATLQDKGYQVSRTKNFWQKGDAYQGINAKIIHPSGFEVELQFHTPDSWDVKQNKSEEIYQMYRVETDNKKRFKHWKSMAKMFAQVAVPIGVASIGDPAIQAFTAGGKQFIFKARARKM